MPHPSMDETSGCCIYQNINKMSVLPQNCVSINTNSDTSLCKNIDALWQAYIHDSESNQKV